MVKHADSQHRCFHFDSSMCHFQNAIGEEGNGKPPHELHFPRKNTEPCLWFLLCLKSSMLNTIGEEGNGKPPHELHFPRKNTEPCLWFLLCLKSSMLNTIGEEGNGKPPHELHFPRKNSEPCLWFLLCLKSSMQRSFIIYIHDSQFFHICDPIGRRSSHR